MNHIQKALFKAQIYSINLIKKKYSIEKIQIHLNMDQFKNLNFKQILDFSKHIIY